MLRTSFWMAAGGVVLCMGMAPPIAAAAIEVVPTSYSFHGNPDGIPDGSLPGTWDYHDWTGNQLTDGQYGTTPWKADRGNGPAYEWVGWVNSVTVGIDFDFGSTTAVDSVEVGSYQALTPALIYLPDVSLFSSDDASTWSPLASEIGTNLDGYYTFHFDHLAFDNQYLRVQFDRQSWLPAGNQWMFTDEVDFFQGASMPEPGALAVWGVLGGLIAAVSWRRRRKAI